MVRAEFPHSSIKPTCIFNKVIEFTFIEFSLIEFAFGVPFICLINDFQPVFNQAFFRIVIFHPLP